MLPQPGGPTIIPLPKGWNSKAYAPIPTAATMAIAITAMATVCVLSDALASLNFSITFLAEFLVSIDYNCRRRFSPDEKHLR